MYQGQLPTFTYRYDPQTRSSGSHRPGRGPGRSGRAGKHFEHIPYRNGQTRRGRTAHTLSKALCTFSLDHACRFLIVRLTLHLVSRDRFIPHKVSKSITAQLSLYIYGFRRQHMLTSHTAHMSSTSQLLSDSFPPHASNEMQTMTRKVLSSVVRCVGSVRVRAAFGDG